MHVAGTGQARVPTLLTSQRILGTLTRNNERFLRAQLQLATGLSVNRPSDDPLASSRISVLDDSLERRDQWLRNLTHAGGLLATLDGVIGEVSDLILEAKSIGLSQIGAGSDAETRAAEAQVIDALIEQVTSLGNRSWQDIRLFGGCTTSIDPYEQLGGGWRYTGGHGGLMTDLGASMRVPLTIPGGDVFGATSERVSGDHDLDPRLTGQTNIADLNGIDGGGVTLGMIEITIDGGESIMVDLTSAQTIDDIAAAIEAAVPGASVQVDPTDERGLVVTPPAGSMMTIADTTGGTVAGDLGIAGSFDDPAGTVCGDLDPRMTIFTPIDQLRSDDPSLLQLGRMRLTNGNQVREVDLSTAETVQDVMNAIESLEIGVLVQINEAGDRLEFVNEVSGTWMSISEVEGGTTASDLGIRSMSESTMLAVFNGGRGVRFAEPDPETGEIRSDFQITLADGMAFEVTLDGATSVGDILEKVRAAATAAGVAEGDFFVGMAADGNGISMTDGTAGEGSLTLTTMNGSSALWDLGLPEGAVDGATLVGEDRARVAVNGLLTHLIALRDALMANDEAGITLATEFMDSDIDRVAQARANVGVRSRRVADAIVRQENLVIQEESIRSRFRDLDFTEAAIRFATLQQQMQAGLATAGQLTTLSLLDYLR